ncbi:MAG: cytochrome c oxidase assembly protein [Rhizomicrobium sp.]|jgi:putative membrane protein
MRRLSALIAAAMTLVCVGVLSRLSGMLFAAHMMQHLLLIAIAAPLLVLGGVRIRIPPLAGWALFVAIFLFWHWPAAFQWAARRPLTELLELGSILAAAVGFWSGVLENAGLNDGARALLVMTAAILTDLPGVVMLFAPRAICVMPGEDTARFGLTPLQDQQIAGLLMWVPANLVFFGIATFLFARWIGAVKPRPA